MRKLLPLFMLLLLPGTKIVSASELRQATCEEAERAYALATAEHKSLKAQLTTNDAVMNTLIAYELLGVAKMENEVRSFISYNCKEDLSI